MCVEGHMASVVTFILITCVSENLMIQNAYKGTYVRMYTEHSHMYLDTQVYVCAYVHQHCSCTHKNMYIIIYNTHFT